MSTKDFNISRDEFRNITRCLDNEEFRGLFMEYCNELRDNKKQYEDELSQLEAQRGYDVKFLKPSPGYVIKTIVDGKQKGFINVCQCDLVQKPTSTSGVNEDGSKGLKWSIPYAQTQPRRDYDNKRVECTVYDVMFHPDSLHLASKNEGFRKLLNDTSLDAVEKAFKVKLDRANLRFPKLQYKGTPSSSVVREKMPHCDSLPKDELFDKLLPPLPNAPISKEDSKFSENIIPKQHTERTGKTKNKENIDRTSVIGTGNNPFYATPEYKIVQCRDVEYGEMTNELDAKIDVTIPRELKVIITLPLLKSASECALDVTKTTLYLVSEKPAKYKLELKLPYEVKENDGKASFNIDERSLTVTLPVLRKRNITLQDINSVNASTTAHPKDSGKLIEEINTIPAANVDPQMGKVTAVPSVVESSKKTVFPKFSVNKMENLLAFTLNVRNVDPSTIQLDNRTDSVYCRFSNLGNGYFPCFYVFFVRFPNAQVTEVQHEEWDNNLIIQITLNTANVSSYHAGPGEHETVEYSIMEDITDKINKFGKEIEDDSLCIAVVRQAKASAKIKSDERMSIEITKREETDQTQHEAMNEIETEKEEEKSSLPDGFSATSAEECDEKDGSEAEKARTMLKAKRNSRKKKKQRSLSDSFCDNLKVIVENEATTGSFEQPKVGAKVEIPQPAAKVGPDTPETKARKARSVSECCPIKESEDEVPTLTRKYKGILKRSSYDRSISECSSVDDLGTSVEMARSIGESECRKTVRFNNSIRKQLFRSNSCILTMKKKAQKRREVKRRADARRMSEGESTDNDEKDTQHPDDEHCSSSDQHDEKDAMEDDSGVSFDSESGDKEAVAVKEANLNGGRGKTASKRKNNNKGTKSAGSKSNGGKKHGSDAKNIEFKSDMIFDIEI
ncbi:protein kintoun [Anopheles moucheti]|uniref:protein kintoun n=1 Tax=Anopheles moucheti TaxID=186751 RepID=UPI0022F0F9E3|nr:protein kintoun [Anopheles moucheti]